MSRKKWLIVMTVSIIILIGAGLFVYNRFRAFAEGQISTRTVDGRTVYEWREIGDQSYPRLSPDNSHKMTMVNYGEELFVAAYKGYYRDLSDLQDLIDNPSGTSVTPNNLNIGSNMSTDGTNIVWAEFPSSGQDKIRGYNISTSSNFDIDTGTVFPYKAAPVISGNYVVWQAKKNNAGTGLNQIFVLNLATSATTQLTNNDSIEHWDPAVSGTKVIWLDQRNYATTGEDIYGYNLATSSEFTVTTMSGNQSSFKFNGRYVLYAGSHIIPGATGNNSETMAKCMGLYLYDTQNNTTTTIVQSNIQISPAYFLSNESDARIVWSEKITNGNGTFWAVKHKKVSDNSASYISNTSTLADHQFPEFVTSSHIFYSKAAAEDELGLPYCYKLSNNTHYQLDNRNCLNLTADNTYALWTTIRTEDNEADEGDNICCTVLP